MFNSLHIAATVLTTPQPCIFTASAARSSFRFMTERLDIKAKAPWPVGALSNFVAHASTFDGVRCAADEFCSRLEQVRSGQMSLKRSDG
ncbi:hypothetical protein [Hyphomicrobium sp.]|uniref:hypothetical protein n=1 Tax=Hyphomicrobium sp. TaxID=82 RepID=UPI0025C66378|nr:hypothetical protein [Hyphomicrobium sp.]MCC7253727.1 hypothetical protein [Hyphomicrobium sp.]